jgi:hypothetical protein
MLTTLAIRQTGMFVGGSIVGLALLFAPGIRADERHAGTVIAVDPGRKTLSIDEFGANAVRQMRTVRLEPGAAVIFSQRNEPVQDWSRVFTDTPIALRDVHRGDYVVVEPGNAPDTASRVTVTLRGGPAS